MVVIQKRESRAPPITYDMWPHLLKERERELGRVKPKRF